MCFSRASRCIIFLVLLPSCTQAAKYDPQQPVRERQLLCWIAGGLPAFNIQYEVQSRGVNFLLDQDWLQRLKSSGADDTLITALQNSRLSGQAAPRDQFADRLFNIIEEKNEGTFSSAQPELEELVRLDKSNPDLLFALGSMLNLQKDWQDAIPVLTEVVRLAPNFQYPHEQLAFAYYRIGVPSAALREADAALALRASDPDAHKFLGLAYLRMQDFKNADREFNEALKLKPDYSLVIADLALSASNQGRERDAIKLYEKAVSIDPKNADFYYGEGISYKNLHQVDDAIAAYKKAKSLAPGDMRIRQNLGAIYCNNDRNEEAVAEFQDLLAIDPDWNMARRCLYESLASLGRRDEAVAVRLEYIKRGGSD
jgi:Flp pilus assembly protein TadD